MASESENNRRQIAAKSLAKKIRLEASMKPVLNKFFLNMSNDLRDSIEQTGNPSKAQENQEALAIILAAHMLRVTTAFSGDTALFTGISVERSPSSIQSFNRERDDFINQRSLDESELITSTNQNEINLAFAAALATLTESGQEGTNAKVAQLSRNEFLRRSRNRVDTIALTETQAPAEKTKEIEIESMLIAGLVSRFSLNRIWTAILDDRVRDAHADADGQSRKSGESFDVGGEQLLFPGDTSRGATAKNVINCRCSLSIEFNAP